MPRTYYSEFKRARQQELERQYAEDLGTEHILWEYQQGRLEESEEKDGVDEFRAAYERARQEDLEGELNEERNGDPL